MSSTYTRPTYLSCAETAKLVRGALKREFPGVKFSVKSSTYSGGASIDISWVDGPRSADVDKVAGLYSGATFDGMIDLKSYHESWLRDADGEPQRVHFGADFVFTHRNISDEWQSEILAMFEGIIGRPIETNAYGPVWHQQVPLSVRRYGDDAGELLHMREQDTEDLSSVFHQYTGFRTR